jgi:hypothetical protein
MRFILAQLPSQRNPRITPDREIFWWETVTGCEP